jgi:S-formylglutathione hydrolase FrmB
MGGHGALTLALKNPGLFRSVSAFSPICAPSQCPWGEKAFTNYLCENREVWKKHDANELIQSSTLEIPFLIDQGGDDPFLEKELNFELFRKTCEKRNQKLTAVYKVDMITVITSFQLLWKIIFSITRKRFLHNKKGLSGIHYFPILS